MSQIVLIFESVLVLTTSNIKNMFRIVVIPVFIIKKNVVGEVDKFRPQAVPVFHVTDVVNICLQSLLDKPCIYV